LSGTSIDHTVSIIVFLSAILIFFGLFGQTVQNAISYQQHNALATKTSDLLDNILLNPGSPSNWSLTDWNHPSKIPKGLGFQDPDFTQYNLSPFSLMRIYPQSGTPINYQGQTFLNNSIGPMNSLLIPSNQVINYSSALQMMGLSGSYAFSLMVVPTVTVSIIEVTHNPLNLSVSVLGQNSPLANAKVTYCLIIFSGNNPPGVPSYSLNYGTSSTDTAGLVYLDLSSFNVNQKSFALIARASLSGLSGIGYFENSMYTSTSIVPLLSSFENRTVILAHSYGINSQGFNGKVSYNAVFLRATDMVQTTLNNGNSNASGTLYIDQTPTDPSDQISIDPNLVGTLVVGYCRSTGESGINIMPWGLSSVGASITFGGQFTNQNWVSTDIRQVTVNDITYQAKLAVWSNKGVSG
jgi:hypothetical protein